MQNQEIKRDFCTLVNYVRWLGGQIIYGRVCGK